ncbi:MAG: molybdopterin-dependent oxidoreductase [Eggerthellaceae bacterium]|nr:molybdopterin-dependent oxidoreductase [Eggerthellaceae bacterium]
MRKPENKKLLKPALAAASLSLVMGLSLTACVPNATQGSEGAASDAGSARLSELSQQTGGYKLEGGLEQILSNLQEQADANPAEIRTLEDGTQVQRTPDSVYNQSALQAVDSDYNIYVLNADARGCEACHTDGLDTLVENMAFPHWPIGNGLHTNINVEDCMFCHDETQGRDGVVPFSQLIHGIHSKDSFKEMGGDCMSCHAPASDTREGLSLWDAVKHTELRGIKKVEDVQGTFTFDQTTVLGDDSTFRVDPAAADGWNSQYAELTNDAYSNIEGDPEKFNNWEITVSGLVENPYTITLGELIAEAPVEEFTAKLNCMLTAPSGTMLGNYNLKGIPMSWLIEKAGGLTDGALGVRATRADAPNSNYNFALEDLYSDGGWLVFEVNGHPLTMAEGWPVRAWYPQHGAYLASRYCNGIEITDKADESYYEGFEYGDQDARGNEFGWRRMFVHQDYTQLCADKPVVAVTYTPEGKIIPVGQPYEFQGYADAWDDPIVALEFSMDGGNTWTRYDTPGADPIAWVYWHFTWTPEEPGAYVLKIRGITESGVVSTLGDEVMVNAK